MGGRTEYCEVVELVGVENVVEVLWGKLMDGWVLVEGKIAGAAKKPKDGELFALDNDGLEVRTWVFERDLGDRWKERMR